MYEIDAASPLGKQILSSERIRQLRFIEPGAFVRHQHLYELLIDGQNERDDFRGVEIVSVLDGVRDGLTADQPEAIEHIVAESVILCKELDEVNRSLQLLERAWNDQFPALHSALLRLAQYGQFERYRFLSFRLNQHNVNTRWDQFSMQITQIPRYASIAIRFFEESDRFALR